MAQQVELVRMAKRLAEQAQALLTATQPTALGTAESSVGDPASAAVVVEPLVGEGVVADASAAAGKRYAQVGTVDAEAPDIQSARKAVRPALRKFVKGLGREIKAMSQPRWSKPLGAWTTWGKCSWHAKCLYFYKGVLPPGQTCRCYGRGKHTNIIASCRKTKVRPPMSKVHRRGLQAAFGGKQGKVIKRKRPREAAGELIGTDAQYPLGKAARQVKQRMLDSQRPRPSQIDTVFEKSLS